MFVIKRPHELDLANKSKNKAEAEQPRNYEFLSPSPMWLLWVFGLPFWAQLLVPVHLDLDSLADSNPVDFFPFGVTPIPKAFMQGSFLLSLVFTHISL